jgi:hypothetical protein
LSKAYRKHAVEDAVRAFQEHEWFCADSILPRATECLPQRSMSINVFAVAKALRVLESRGVLHARKKNGVKEYSRVEGEWDGRAHFHA